MKCYKCGYELNLLEDERYCPKWCNRDIQRYFHVNSRNNVPKKRFDDAIEYVQHWQPCTNTQIAIKECNSQLRFA